LKIERIHKLEDGQYGKLRAFFDLKTTDGFVIKGFKIVEGINGMFVGMPSNKNKEGEYSDAVYADKELRAELEKLAMRAYGQDSTSNLPASSAMEDTPPPAQPTKEFDDTDIPF
jgi:stage V sporulation protein G